MVKNKEKMRCGWCLSDPLYIQYHDQEWGVPVHVDKKLFEFLILEGMQAGLNWLTILKKREGYRKAFTQFDVHKVAQYGERDVQKCLNDTTIIRNLSKIRAVVTNAQNFLQIQEEFGSFDTYCWGFVDGVPLINQRKKLSSIPTVTKRSEKFSRDLKQRGFKFVGPTIMYAYMQAIGMVNDHLITCFCYS